MSVFHYFLKIFVVLSPFCWIRIRIAFVWIRIRNKFFHILDPDPYQNDTNPPHWYQYFITLTSMHPGTPRTDRKYDSVSFGSREAELTTNGSKSLWGWGEIVIRASPDREFTWRNLSPWSSLHLLRQSVPVTPLCLPQLKNADHSDSAEPSSHLWRCPSFPPASQSSCCLLELNSSLQCSWP